MSAGTSVSSRSWKVGAYTVTMTVPRPKAGELCCVAVEWSPREPTRLSSRELDLYRLRRNEAIAEISGELGISVAVLDL